MSKRTIAIILIILGIAAIIGILIWTFYPAYEQSLVAQPPALPNQVPTTGFQPTATSSGQNIPVPNQPVAPPAAGNAQQLELSAQEQLKQRAIGIAGRMGSYSNVDRFESLRIASIDADANLMKYLDTQRDQLMTAHPQQNGSWSQVTRSLSARITQGLPILSAQKATVMIQAQVSVQESGTAQAKVEYQEITLEFVRSNGQWLASRIDRKPLE